MVIVNYRSSAALRMCLSSLVPTSVSSITILDNDSGAAEREQLRELEQIDARVQVFHSEANIGFGPGVNLALDLADPAPEDYVWILNPDTLVQPDVPELLSRALESGADIVSPLILTGHPEVIWFAGGEVDERRGVSWHFDEGASPPRGLRDPFATTFITGAAPMMTAHTWHALGGFRDDLFLYWEDADLSRRAVAAELVLQVVPDARVWHAQGASSATGRGGNGPAFYYYNQRNRVLICGEQVGRWRLVGITGLRETVRLLAKPLLLERSSRLSTFAASARGLRDGIAGRSGPGPLHRT